MCITLHSNQHNSTVDWQQNLKVWWTSMRCVNRYDTRYGMWMSDSKCGSVHVGYQIWTSDLRVKRELAHF